MPNFGTMKLEKTYPGTKPTPKTTEELFEEYKKFSLLQKKDSMMSNIEAGTATYLVSMRWLKKYLDFILFDQFKRETTEANLEIDDDHFTKNHPGLISNEKDLLEDDKDE